ncbi:hypothetical protein [Gordonia sp. (in: high G+C Gram-positive bacteria)]|uniref:hypothetical protein n=1 Tax=Gordonia sp. (in: high G+C Gram-positive bacteria) TaxID=84139 RepID=UPI0016903C09|nr:hypothetical protein [Gordonia sp. (in: high G+C Gram-positive bacteria)]NLG47960.1 hypothetical protein [Gordonia sp. (in: high G+C Gram-positive bacteria)]
MKPQIKWVLAAAVVLLVGFISLQQTSAAWRSEESSGGGGTITAGELNISAGNSGVKQFTLDGLTLENAGRGDSVQKALPVINSGNVTMQYRLNGIATSGDAPLTFRVAKVNSAAECTPTGNVGTELYNGAGNAATFPARKVAKDSTEVLCLRVTIATNAETSQSSKATYTFAANSVAGA